MTLQDTDKERRTLELGREFIVVWAALLRAVRLYGSANAILVSHCEQIHKVVMELLEVGDVAEITTRHDSIFVNGFRIREAAVASTSYHRLIDLLRAGGIGTLSLEDELTAGDLELFARLLLEAADGHYDHQALERELSVRGVTGVRIEAAQETEDLPDDLTAEQMARRAYLRSISVVKGIFVEYRASDRINARRVKRVVQSVIDALESAPDSLLQMTSLKNYDEYTFNHSVNVSVLAIALGRHIGLTRQQLYTVGQAGMLHDLGKLSIPKDLLNKEGRLTPTERQLIESHAMDGFVSIAKSLGASADTIDIALTAFEHHLNEDGTGYPQVATARPKGLLSRLITIVDRYDAMTSDRIYRPAMSPQKSLSIMFNLRASHYDQTLLKYFMNLLGYYPLGTVVCLSDGSIGIVLGGPSQLDRRHLPTVTVILDRAGQPTHRRTIDLSDIAKDEHSLHVAHTVDPKDYGIEVMDYILWDAGRAAE